MKKIFVDIYLMFNLGDDLFLDVLVKKFPNCEFTVNYLGENYDRFLSAYPNVKKRKYSLLNKIGQRLKITDSITNFHKVAEEHDALLFLGGSIFREEDYHHSLYKERMEIAKEFKKRQKPIFILGANFGPYKTEKFLNDYYQFFKLCNDVCFRDLYSYELFKNLPQVRYAPDIIFQKNVEKYKGLTINNRVGFSIIDVRHKHGLSSYFNEYISSTIKTIELLVNRGYECYLMSFCKNEGDLEIINIIQSQLSKQALQKVATYEYQGKLEEAINLIASFKLFVAARFHANILALILGIGVMPVIYSKKTSNMLIDINLNEILITMDKLYLQYDDTTIDKSFNNKNNLKSVISGANNQFVKLSEFLGVNLIVQEEV
ncbi:polysaccharide pyruvyl transferase family protein [Bacillus sp. EB600]|uniref:polysaccharide pyruvyl transferase family protein n=1 Tax=Bacillus sp. EB600 TaxID=2806345 RepID=UPI002109F04C|nr:polysaccharide pyruvyl transferase family protein [Bacillus sp. EB600]MCQ6278886.1 polysaccharide pyruvyl transferase family protein [Bacillus sp. EB600]